MLSSLGSLKCDGSSIVGTFDVEGSPRYIAVDVRPSTQPFECKSATLTYSKVAQLDGYFKWKGTAGKDDLEMSCDNGGVSIVGTLATTRPSSHIHGAGSWSTVEQNLPSVKANGKQQNVRNVHVNSFPPLDTVGDDAKAAREQQLIDLGAPIIAIFGQSGVGKSTFINLIASEQQKVGRGLQSCTNEVSAIDAKVGGQSVVVIDTPGFDNTRAGMKDDAVLTIIAEFLNIMAERKAYVTGVLILHRVTDIALSQTSHRIAKMLGSLCGDNAMKQLMLCTTMWDTIREDEGYDRFDELCKTDAWKEMISKGAGTAIISTVSPNANVEAEKIVTQLIKNAQPVELAIQNEMVHQKLKVAETSAGRSFSESLQDPQTKAKYERQLLDSGVPIVAIFGQSGTGKSTFVNLITSGQQKVSDSLQSCTRDVSVIEAKVGGERIVVIDTPGFDDTHGDVKESDVLKKIAKCFENMGKRKVYVTGVLFLHRINDNKFSQTANRVSNMLKSLCGDGAMNQLMLCTTMWDRVPEAEGVNRFDELCETGAWKQMILGGASTATISNTGSNAKAEAEEIVTRLIKNAQPVQVAIQDEMANQKLGVGETKAGKYLIDEEQKQAKSKKEAKKILKRSIWRRLGCVIQ